MKFSSLVTSVIMFMSLTVLTGILYPLVMTGICEIAFPDKAHGSMVTQNGRETGSSLLGQQFSSSRYFHPRPSAVDYNPLPSSGSNWGPAADTLMKLVYVRERAFRLQNGLDSTTSVPAEMLFASASGLDPHISPESAYLQVDRIARARGWGEELRRQLTAHVAAHIEPRQLGVLGEPRINVLLLNLDLDSMDSGTRAGK